MDRLISYPETPFLSTTELPIQNTHTIGGSGGPGRRGGGRTTLQMSSNRSNVKPLARPAVTNVVNLRPKTTIFGEKAVGLTTFVTTDQKTTRKTPWIDDVCNNTQKIGQKSQRARPHWCGGRRRVRSARAAVPVGGGGAWPGFETTRRTRQQRPSPTGAEGAGGTGGHGRASRRGAERSEAA